MKRLQIMIEEELDAELDLRAKVAQTSKAALIRLYVREAFERDAWKPIGPDSGIWKLVGAGLGFEPIEEEDDIDRIVYGI